MTVPPLEDFDCILPPPAITVEALIYWIKRATRPDSGGAHDAWDREYAHDILNDFVPGLGDYVWSLPHEYTDEDSIFPN